MIGEHPKGYICQQKGTHNPATWVGRSEKRGVTISDSDRYTQILPRKLQACRYAETPSSKSYRGWGFLYSQISVQLNCLVGHLSIWDQNLPLLTPTTHLKKKSDQSLWATCGTNFLQIYIGGNMPWAPQSGFTMGCPAPRVNESPTNLAGLHEMWRDIQRSVDEKGDSLFSFQDTCVTKAKKNMFNFAKISPLHFFTINFPLSFRRCRTKHRLMMRTLKSLFKRRHQRLQRRCYCWQFPAEMTRYTKHTKPNISFSLLHHW